MFHFRGQHTYRALRTLSTDARREEKIVFKVSPWWQIYLLLSRYFLLVPCTASLMIYNLTCELSVPLLLCLFSALTCVFCFFLISKNNNKTRDFYQPSRLDNSQCVPPVFRYRYDSFFPSREHSKITIVITRAADDWLESRSCWEEIKFVITTTDVLYVISYGCHTIIQRVFSVDIWLNARVNTLYTSIYV